MKMFEKYRSCVLAFGELLYPKIRIKGKDIFMQGINEAISNLSMKCLRETENEDIAKEFAMTSALKGMTMIAQACILQVTGQQYCLFAST